MVAWWDGCLQSPRPMGLIKTHVGRYIFFSLKQLFGSLIFCKKRNKLLKKLVVIPERYSQASMGKIWVCTCTPYMYKLRQRRHDICQNKFFHAYVPVLVMSLGNEFWSHIITLLGTIKKHYFAEKTLFIVNSESQRQGIIFLQQIPKLIIVFYI